MWRRGLIIAGGAALLLAFVVFLNYNHEPVIPPQKLPDGTLISLTGVQFGQKVEFLHGTAWQKLQYRILPPNGLRLAGHLYSRPKIAIPRALTFGNALFLEFKVDLSGTQLPATIQLQRPTGPPLTLLQTPVYRLVVTDQDGFDFFEPPLGFPSNGYNVTALLAYPRQAAKLNLQLQQRGSSPTSWTNVARFDVPLKPQPEQKWTPVVLPATKTVGNIDFTVGEVLVEEVLPGRGIGVKHEGQISLKMTENGHPSANWNLVRAEALDAGGNELSLTTFPFGQPGSEWLTFKQIRVPDPRKIWRLRLYLARTSDFAASNLAAFSFSPPIASQLPVRPLVLPTFTTNLLGVPVSVFLNSSSARFAPPADRPDLRISVLLIKPSGETQPAVLAPPVNGGDSFSFRNYGNATNYTVTLAIHSVYQFECFVQPTGNFAAAKRD